MIDISLGGRKWALEPLTLRQLRVVLPELSAMGKAITNNDLGAVIDHAACALRGALSRSDPEITVDQILDLQCSQTELLEAVFAIAAASGLTQGEALAVARRINGGSPSTDFSPPPADTPIPSLTQ
jgi:hypothetical protein